MKRRLGCSSKGRILKQVDVTARLYVELLDSFTCHLSNSNIHQPESAKNKTASKESSGDPGPSYALVQSRMAVFSDNKVNTTSFN